MPSTLTRKSASAPARSDVRPATWKTRVDVAHRPAHGPAVEHVAAHGLDVEAVEVVDDRPWTRTVTRTRSPRATSWRVTCEPTRPVAPVTSVTLTRGSLAPPSRLRVMPVAVVTDTTHYMPREIVEQAGLHEVSLYVNDGDALERESAMPDFDALLRAAAHAERAADDVAAVDRRLPRGLRAAGRERARHRVGPPLRRHLRHLRSARQAAATILERGGQRRIEVVDSHSACGGLGLIALAAAAAARGGQSVEQVVARAETRDRRDEDLVRASTRWSTCAAAGGSARRRRGSAER